MASLRLSKGLRSTLLALPPHLRAATYHSIRPFSASASRESTLVDFAVAGPSAILDGIHNLGVPWSVTIPLTAVLVRTTFVYYFSTVPSRRAAAIRNQLLPLVSAKVRLKRNSEEHRAWQTRLRTGEINPMLLMRIHEVFASLRYRISAMNQLGKQFGARSYHPRGLLNFGVLIAFTEVIRLKCGRREGLLSLVLSPFEWIARQYAPDRFPPKAEFERRDPVEALVERLEAARQKTLAISQQAQVQDPPTGQLAVSSAQEDQEAFAQQQGNTHQLDALTGPDATSPYFDPILQTEGLSWCVDLTVPDPTFLLPSILGLTMAATFLLRPKVGGLKPNSISVDPSRDTNNPDQANKPISALPLPPPRTSLLSNLTFGQRFGLSITILFVYAATNMPAAILLYFIPSIAIGWLQNRYLDLKYPIRPAIQPCTRPLRMKVRKDLGQL